MTSNNKTSTRLKKLRREILLMLSNLYLFPQSDRAIRSILKDQFTMVSITDVRDSFYYLKKRRLVDLTEIEDGVLTARITSYGIDIAEGATRENGILESKVSIASLNLKRELRRWILKYCSWYPDSFNSDDEIYSELKDQQKIGLTSLERIRVDIWYLAGKGYVEMKTQPLFGDFIYLARISANGIDLIGNIISDPGVDADG